MVTKKNTNVDIKGVLNGLEQTTKETNDNTINEKNMNSDTKVNTGVTTTDSINTTKETNIDTNKKFVIKKKVDDKKDKKAFNIYMADSLVKDLDKLSKKTGYSRNELINIMCQECLNNYEIVEE